MFDKFIAFKSHVEKKSSKSIKVLCIDNESRYVSSRLRDFCELEGIDHHNPIAFSPQKSSVATMRIRTLKSMESCMIQAKSLDPSLEVKAISSANNILNRSPHNILDGMTPFET